jgi:hypothetical protein
LKTLPRIAAGLLVAYLALVLWLNHFDALAGLCSQAFTLPGLLCRVGSVGAGVLLVPLCGVVGYVLAGKVLKR